MGARIDGLARQDIFELPIRTIREIITNAVCHRSYISPGKVQVALYSDRLEVTSPGMLDYGLTIEKMKAGLSRIRNRGIAEVFSYMHMIEGWGSGIPDMFTEARIYGLPEPLLEDMGSDFRVNLYRRVMDVDQNGVVAPNTLRLNETNYETDETNETNHETNETNHETDEIELNLNEMQLLAAIRLKPDITQKQLHDTTGISMSTIKRILPDLQKKGKLVRVGNHRSGTWKII